MVVVFVGDCVCRLTFVVFLACGFDCLWLHFSFGCCSYEWGCCDDVLGVLLIRLVGDFGGVLGYVICLL